MIVWDEGGYRNLSRDRSGAEIPFAEALRNGHASFWLDGAKLHGGYALTRIRNNRGTGEAWLLVKEKDRRATPGRSTPDPWRARSVRSGRTLRQMAARGDGAAGEDGAAGGGRTAGGAAGGGGEGQDAGRGAGRDAGRARGKGARKTAGKTAGKAAGRGAR